MVVTKHNAVYLVLKILISLVLVIVFLIPFAWMISISLRPDNEVMKFPPSLLGGNFTLSAYPAFFDMIDFGKMMLNTVFVATTVAATSTFSSAVAGYAFAKYNFKGKKVIFYALIATMMIPVFVILVPLYLMFMSINWLNTYQVLIVPFMASTMGIFLIRQFSFSVPDELIHSARIDGANEYYLFGKIILPILLPPMISLFILTFMGQWDSLLWPIIMTTTRKYWTIAIGLSVVSRENGLTTNWNKVMVGALVSTAPIIVMYVFLQRFFIESITLTGLKE